MLYSAAYVVALLLAVLMFWAGLVKLTFLHLHFREAVESWNLRPLRALEWGVPGWEVGTGGAGMVALALGRGEPAATWLVASTLAGFAAAQTLIAARAGDPACGCFGRSRPLQRATLARTSALAAVAGSSALALSLG
ncbi:MAG: MauE/DoxX family redox-associated membrane protein [Tepidiformaceae bacterium]